MPCFLPYINLFFLMRVGQQPLLQKTKMYSYIRANTNPLTGTYPHILSSSWIHLVWGKESFFILISRGATFSCCSHVVPWIGAILMPMPNSDKQVWLNLHFKVWVPYLPLNVGIPHACWFISNCMFTFWESHPSIGLCTVGNDGLFWAWRFLTSLSGN